ncbi:MAG: small basic protein [Candidatus Omnitrophota bacterium]
MMSQHPSLKISQVDIQRRNVLKRSERVKLLKEQGKLDKISSLFKLPKTKIIRVKIKKEKVEEKATTTPEATPPTS